MKILIVAMSNSIHTARWISHISGQGWEIHLFPTDTFTSVHPGIKNVTVHSPRIIKFIINRYKLKKEDKTAQEDNFDVLMDNFINRSGQFLITSKELIKRIFPDLRAHRLAKVIKKIKPDIVHSMHIQAGGYLTFETKKRLHGKFPKWIVTNWGSELSLFSRISSQEDKIKEVLLNCDYFSGECKRDIGIVRRLGFKGKTLPVIPNSGGIDFNLIYRIRKPGPTSDRKNIVLKGYQNWAGRALTGLRAIERCADILKDYKILLYCVDTFEVMVSTELLKKNTGIKTQIIPVNTPHEEVLKHHGSARISIGLSITDAISTSLLEAMVMGSFPIQSNTSCASEWFKDGQTGILVNPEDPDEIEKAIRLAIADDNLVNKASELNYDMLFERIEKSKIKEQIIKTYKDINNNLL